MAVFSVHIDDRFLTAIDELAKVRSVSRKETINRLLRYGFLADFAEAVESQEGLKNIPQEVIAKKGFKKHIDWVEGSLEVFNAHIKIDLDGEYDLAFRVDDAMEGFSNAPMTFTLTPQPPKE